MAATHEGRAIAATHRLDRMIDDDDFAKLAVERRDPFADRRLRIWR